MSAERRPLQDQQSSAVSSIDLIDLIDTSIYRNLEISAERYPGRPAIIFDDNSISYARLFDEVQRLATYLSTQLNVQPKERVLLYMQNSPQYIIAYYAVLRLSAVVVPVNPMSRSTELEYYLLDTEAVAIVCGSELAAELLTIRGCPSVRAAIIAKYSDYSAQASRGVPEELVTADVGQPGFRLVSWTETLATHPDLSLKPPQPKDWCLIAYSSGTTGKPKGCLHTHVSVNAVVGAQANWLPAPPAARYLASLPLFHVTGMQNSMNVPIFHGSTIVLMKRWDARTAAELIRRYRITHWRSIATMMVDFMNQGDLLASDVESLTMIGGGGAAMPAALSRRLTEVIGLPYIEGYGLTETAAATHINPPDLPKLQCLGLPIGNVISRIVDPDTLDELKCGEIGEIIVSGPQLFEGYWRNSAATQEAILVRNGRRYLRTGDLGYVDEDGYFFLVDRLKRMINVAGFKVWPAEVETVLHEHEEIREACVVAKPDRRRGECVKAFIVLVEHGSAPPDLTAWCRARMAAYKVPSMFEFVTVLPRTATGKVAWRELQDTETHQIVSVLPGGADE